MARISGMPFGGFFSTFILKRRFYSTGMGESGHVARGRMGVLREDPDAGEEIEGMDRDRSGPRTGTPSRCSCCLP